MSAATHATSPENKNHADHGVAGSGRGRRQFLLVRHDPHRGRSSGRRQIARNSFRSRFFSRRRIALADAAKEGESPESNSPEDLREYVQKALRRKRALTSSIDAEVGYSLLVYEVTIVDVNGTVLISSDASLPGNQIPVRDGISANSFPSSFIQQLTV